MMRQQNTSTTDDTWIDGVIEQLLSARNKKPGTLVEVSPNLQYIMLYIVPH